jgi:DNA-binding NarL/FixJ family response regulator
MNERQYRIIIADDHQVVREAIRVMLEMEPEFEVVGEASDGQQALQLADQLRPDLALMDIRMDRMDGVEATRVLRQRHPAMGVLILTGFGDDEVLLNAVEAGAQGFLLKDASADEVKSAILRVVQGESHMTPSLLRKLLDELAQRERRPEPAHSELTPREREVLLALSRGLTNEEIARELVISEKTVKTHLGSIFGKLHVDGRAQAMLYAIREGLVELS